MSRQNYPLVSIGIPTYNRAGDYLRQALESALAQTYPDIEIIVSNNCSTDDTEAVVKGYDDSRIRYFHQDTPLIPNDNFNFCLQQANGAYFLMLHDDDKIDHDFVEGCMRAADYDTGIGIIISGLRIINAKGDVIKERRNRTAGLSVGDFFLAWFVSKIALYLCCTLYNTKGLKEIGGFRSRHNLFQDVGATAKLAAKMGRVDVEEVKASARQHGGKWTHVARVREWCEDSIDLIDLFCELAPDKRAEISKQGQRFFANINYSRASDIRSLMGRAMAYWQVYRTFKYRYPPSVGMIFQSTALYRGLRYIKRKMLGMPAWVD